MNDSNKNGKPDKTILSEKIKEQISLNDDISRVFVEQQSNIINEVNESIHSEASKNK